ncbi:hypothetical protein CCACVL1_14775 [Corchorus capsularis]|uniref:Uncharacterized protein n=1 Tax=Corchorus capsularis TaxID=210143 RepID=A0A1R3I5M5_COCAP|nr:hypothetical protein CCACVL1_14775 [Corchorus capsularis]
MTRLLDNEYNAPRRLNYHRFAVKTLTTHAKTKGQAHCSGAWALPSAALGRVQLFTVHNGVILGFAARPCQAKTKSLVQSMTRACWPILRTCRLRLFCRSYHRIYRP